MFNYSRCYEDCLQPRRQESSNFMWSSRPINPKIAFKQYTKTTPSSHKSAVLKSPKIQELLEVLSREQRIPKEQLEEKVWNILDEIGYKKNHKVIRWIGLVLIKICIKVCSGIYVNNQSILRLKSRMGNSPVIFVPSHRSYADFIMLSFICFNYDVEIPVIAAGMDFHGMWGMGSMLRDTGAFFMRRSYNDDSLYWNTFKQYVYQLVTKGELPIEFFIEGTRSRSNKSISPKYGLILMVLKAFFFAEVPDILFVPINISYDRIMEETLFAYELLGVPKPKESTSRFFKSLKILREKFGNIYFHVDEPISVKDYFGDSLDRSVHSMAPLHQQELNENEKSLIPSLAHNIIRRQQQCAVITTFNLIAIVLNNILSNNGQLLIIPELVQEIHWLKSVLESLGAFVYEKDLEKGVHECLTVHKSLIELLPDGRIGLVRNKIVLDKVDSSKLKAHGLSEKTMTYAVPFVLLQLYINPTLHYLIDPALVVIILKCQNELDRGELFGHYHFLRSLFSLEFITYGEWEQKDFENALRNLERLDVMYVSNGKYVLKEHKKFEDVLFNSIEPFILSYFVACEILQSVRGTCDEKPILASIQEELENAINDNTKFVHPYCLSLDTLNNALSSFSSLGVLKKIRSKNKTEYKVDNRLVQNLKEKLEFYIPSFAVVKALHIHLKNKL